MKQQQSTIFKKQDAWSGFLAAACGPVWVCSLLEIACGSLQEVLQAGSFGGILNLYLRHRASYDAAVHRVYAETGSMLLPAAALLLAAVLCGLCFLAAQRRGGIAFSLIFAVFSIPMIALQLMLPSADVRIPGLYLTLAGAVWLLGAFGGNHQKAISFLAFLLLTGAACGGIFTAAGGEDALGRLRESRNIKIETCLHGGEGSGMTFGRFGTDAAAERGKAAQSEGENAEAAVLRVTMSSPQTYYLRGCTADIYTTEGWKSAESPGMMSGEQLDAENALFYRLGERKFDSRTMLAAARQAAGLTQADEDVNVIRIRNTGASRRYLYLPYEAQSIQAEGTPLLGGGFLPERSRPQQYTVTALPYSVNRYGEILDELSASAETGQSAYRQSETNYRDYVLRYDSEVPEVCRSAIAEIFPDAEKIKTSGEAKTAILETLSGLQYDETISDNKEEDFVTGFLTRRAGYDKHFAAAAVMAFRYYGIPARFAEGYLITDEMTEGVKAGEEIAVTAAEAHCWAEYYEDGIGWLPFETTPTYLGLMESAGSIQLDVREELQPEKKPKKTADDKTRQIVSRESEVNYWVPGVLLIFLLLLLGAGIRQLYRRHRKKQAASGRKPRRKDMRDADRRKAVLALWYFIRRRERKEERQHKEKAGPAPQDRTRKEIEEIYLEARYSMHEIHEEKYRKVWQYYQQIKRRRPRKKAKSRKPGSGAAGLLCLLLAACIAFTGCGAKDEAPYRTALKQVQDYLRETVTEAASGSVGGEWAVLALTRGDSKLPEDFLECYQQNTEKMLREAGGILHTATGYKYTEYARIILGWTAAGQDPADAAGYNLLEKLTDMQNVCRQGINGPIWALIAYDCGGYTIPEIPAGTADRNENSAQTSREALLTYILENRTLDGGWTLSGKEADVDLTAMALTAMAPYVCDDAQLCAEVSEDTRKEVKAAAGMAISCLAAKKLPSGGFESWGSENAESCAQVITALSALGIDAETDESFAGTLDALLAFQQEDGGFAHTREGGTNLMATEQAAYALAAYERMKNGEPRLFDMR